jgi:uncharacterized OB-fold protein
MSDTSKGAAPGGDYRKPLPNPSEVSRPYWEGTKAHELRLQRCRDCGRHIHYPRPMCPFCLSENLDWTVAKGTGKVHSYTVVRRVTNPAFRDDVTSQMTLVKFEPSTRQETT